MKQVFNWLREQFGKIIGEVHSPADVVWNNALKMCISKVDEAEAKWEAECCEQKWNKEDQWYDTSCGHILEPHCYNFCPYCGKPIKISEVE